MQFDLWDSDDVPVPRNELLQKVKGVDALMCVLTEKIDAELLDAAGQKINSSGKCEKIDKLNLLASSCLRSSCRSKPEGPQHHVSRV